MVLGSTQPQTKMSTRGNWRRVNAVGAIELTTLPPSCEDCIEIFGLQLPAALRASSGP